MGFYQPAQIVIDAKKHGVEVRPIDINYSSWDNILEEKGDQFHSIRLGFRQVKGLHEEDMVMLLPNRQEFYQDIPSLRTVGVSQAALERLADADAFRSIGLDRRKAIWEVSALGDRPIGIFEEHSSKSDNEEGIQLPEMALSEHVIQDYGSMSLSLKAHPVSFVRDKLSMLGITPANDLSKLKDGTPVKVAGLVLVRQRPGTASGIVFITIEDETGTSNLVVFKKLFDTYRKEVTRSTLLMVEGKLQREGEVIHVIAKRCFDFTGFLQELTKAKKETLQVSTLSRADEKDGGVPDSRIQKEKIIQADMFPGSRDFK
jgi:error-prone DNA polymerase